MCGIIGYYNKNVTKSDLDTLRKVLIESKIRGKHASGIAWFDGKKFQSYIKPTSIDKLMKKFDLSKSIYNGASISLIAHARYSTSDIKYNQPILGETLAIAHNGVVTQDFPENWYETYGFKCKTKNDSELILHALENERELSQIFPKSSIAVVSLDLTGKIEVYRNGLRPLWQGTIGDGVVIASTQDILHRAGVQNIKKVPAVDATQDLQRRDMTQWTSQY